MKKMEKYKFEEPSDEKQSYVTFAKEIAPVEHENHSDHTFLGSHFIIQQNYFLQKSKEELRI